MSNQNNKASYIKPFLFGGISGCTAVAVIMPLDTWKVRLQIYGENKGISHGSTKISPIEVAKEMYKVEGLKGFYQGMGSAMLRQLTYATARLGIYKVIADQVKINQKRDLSFFEKVGASSFSGLCGALIGNPTDICLVRFQADATLPIAERRNYKNAFDALYRIIKEEGVPTLWRGSTPTVLRAIAITVGQLTTYDEIKQWCMKIFLRKKETMSDRIMASVGAGVVTSVLSLPFDNMKTKLQKMKLQTNGKYPYSGVADCFLKTIQREKITGLWVGLPVYFARVAPQSIIILLVQDLLHHVFEKH
ncbi:unnamed protein product [Paramecium pentaurelia]|uniref:Uncharacterized protein n=1 Tax=Paramecium pentaurelia TaxID=43138 RepID=A0A8S1S8Q4_9CILI|nr:unnamed protein product [Paramecium pentaurelia]